MSGDAIAIGSEISALIHQWAWDAGKNYFPADLFKSSSGPAIFLKHIVATQLQSITPSKEAMLKSPLAPEINNLQLIRPHAIITTNYDTFLETVFDGYEPIVGQKVIRYDLNSFGEIFKIHGSIGDPSSMILVKSDFENYNQDQAYIAAKLLTYFAEHPVFVFGYGFNDPNVAALVADLGRLISDDEGLIRNIFFVKWDQDAGKKTFHPSEHLITSGGKEFRTRAISTDDLSWIFKALSNDQALTSVNTKLVRALAARSYKLVRSDIPKGKVEVDYQILEQIANEEKSLPTLLGISSVTNGNQTHPYTISMVADMLDFKHWNRVHKLIKKVESDTGYNMCQSDNGYWCRIRTGKKSTTAKFSKAAVQLLIAARDAKPYKIDKDIS